MTAGLDEPAHQVLVRLRPWRFFAEPARMAHRDTLVSELCRELGIRPVTLYTYVGPQGQLREQGQKVSSPPEPEYWTATLGWGTRLGQ